MEEQVTESKEPFGPGGCQEVATTPPPRTRAQECNAPSRTASRSRESIPRALTFENATAPRGDDSASGLQYERDDGAGGMRALGDVGGISGIATDGGIVSRYGDKARNHKRYNKHHNKHHNNHKHDDEFVQKLFANGRVERIDAIVKKCFGMQIPVFFDDEVNPRVTHAGTLSHEQVCLIDHGDVTVCISNVYLGDRWVPVGRVWIGKRRLISYSSEPWRVIGRRVTNEGGLEGEPYDCCLLSNRDNAGEIEDRLEQHVALLVTLQASFSGVYDRGSICIYEYHNETDRVSCIDVASMQALQRKKYRGWSTDQYFEWMNEMRGIDVVAVTFLSVARRTNTIILDAKSLKMRMVIVSRRHVAMLSFVMRGLPRASTVLTFCRAAFGRL